MIFALRLLGLYKIKKGREGGGYYFDLHFILTVISSRHMKTSFVVYRT